MHTNVVRCESEAIKLSSSLVAEEAPSLLVLEHARNTITADYVMPQIVSALLYNNKTLLMDNKSYDSVTNNLQTKLGNN